MAADTGHGATVSIDTNPVIYDIVEITQAEMTVPDVDISHLGIPAPGPRQFMPGDLIDAGTFTLRCLFDPEQTSYVWPVIADIVITGPISNATNTVAGAIAGKAYINAIKPNDYMTDTVQETELTFRWTGDAGGPTFTPEAAA